MFRYLVAFSTCINAVITAVLSIIGIQGLQAWGVGISSANGSEEFGAGMLVGGFVVVVWILAAVFAFIAYMSWRCYQRIKSLGYYQKKEIAVLTIGLISALFVIAAVLARLLM